MAELKDVLAGKAAKATPVDADILHLNDSAAANALKTHTFANLKAFLKTYFDSLYAALSHSHTIANVTSLQTELDGKSSTSHNHDAAYEAKNVNIQTHIASTSNPHTVTKAQVGLGNCDNTSDLAKPISTATQTALDGKSSTSHNHDAAYSAISHTHTADSILPSQVGQNGRVLKSNGTTAAWQTDNTGAGGEAFPVGSIFISVVSTNPGTLLGYGTWSAFGAGRTLVGIDAGQTEFDTVLETGGAKTHTLTESEIPSHTHAVTDPGHTHLTQRYPTATGASSGFTIDTSMSGTLADNTLPTKSNTTGITVGNAGSGGSHNNLQPYIVVYFWERTA
jgi:hypothetical protein